MIKKLLSACLIMTSLLFFTTPSLAYDPLSGACSSAGGTSVTCQENTKQAAAGNPNPVTGTTGVLRTATNIVAILTGIVAIIMIVISGIRYASSAGNQEKAKKARSTLIAAIIGLIIAALAWTIITFVIKKIVQ